MEAQFLAEARLLREPRRKDGVIEQFDGYFSLEDAPLAEVRGRLKHEKEYWGGAYGVASDTQIIKQADVIALLCMRPELAAPADWVANYDYYLPRTEHGSSLSACMYALAACRVKRVEDGAYPLFLKSARADLVGGGKAWAGLVYIGGTHPASAGGSYMVLLRGFLGLGEKEGRLTLAPALPAAWKRVRLNLCYRGEWRSIEVKA
jgi:kojibiose phosphorylase/nigerose phosphorylase